jgi:short-subunit dehydrogenase involved in D-alanine esterification of teichoic acids
MNTNLFGPINMTKAILPYFRQKKEGKLVFMGSVNGFQGATASSPYTASKFALEGLNICSSVMLLTDPYEQVTLNVFRRSSPLSAFSRLFSNQEDLRRSFFLPLEYRVQARHIMNTKSFFR